MHSGYTPCCLRIHVAALFLIVLLAPGPKPVAAQVLITGENGGRGAHAVMVSANAIFPKDYTVMTNLWMQYGYGISGRVDGFASYGSLVAFGKAQSYVSLGSNIGLLRRKKFGVDLSLYNNASVALNRRDQACNVLLYSAIVASRPFQLGRFKLTPYAGFSRLAPIGNRANKVFTPGEVLHSAVLGAAFPLGRNLTLCLEYNPAPVQRSGGLGLLYVLRQP